MPHHQPNYEKAPGLLLPVGTIVFGVFIVLMLLVQPANAPLAQEQPTTYVPPTDTPQTGYADPVGTVDPAGTPTNTSEPQDNNATDDDTDTGGNAQAQPTLTPSETVQPSETPTRRPTRTPDLSTPTDTLVPTETPDTNLLTCSPGVPTVIEGEGPPNTALVIYLDRRPVGGGLTNQRGTYQIPIVVGPERPGDHLVQIRLRDNYVLLRELVCVVPTPTPAISDRFEDERP